MPWSWYLTSTTCISTDLEVLRRASSSRAQSRNTSEESRSTNTTLRYEPEEVSRHAYELDALLGDGHDIWTQRDGLLQRAVILERCTQRILMNPHHMSLVS